MFLYFSYLLYRHKSGNLFTQPSARKQIPKISNLSLTPGQLGDWSLYMLLSDQIVIGWTNLWDYFDQEKSAF